MDEVQFIHNLKWELLPETVRRYARLCLLDTLGAAIGGRQTPASHAAYDFAALAFAGQGSQLWFDGREVSPPGATFAHGVTIDSLDIHDGYKPSKGHAGVAQIPATIATLSLETSPPVSGSEFLTTLVVGYEIALRAALALHETACDYHSSGAWNALGTAAVTARRQRLGPEQTRHALGIAEYHGPRSQLMRCADYPTMIKDGSGWGAMTGVSAALLAASGFTGAPALTVEAANVAMFWQDLGRHWLITEQYFKPFAVCYWAQPAVTGALALQRQHSLHSENIEHIRLFVFDEASHMTIRHPKNTEEAQYSLPFPVAAALIHGHLGPAELTGSALSEPSVLRLANRIEIIKDSALSARYPAERLARVEIIAGGQKYDSGVVAPRWGDVPPTDVELRHKFRWLTAGSQSPERLLALEEMVLGLENYDNAADLEKLLAHSK